MVSYFQPPEWDGALSQYGRLAHSLRREVRYMNKEWFRRIVVHIIVWIIVIAFAFYFAPKAC